MPNSFIHETSIIDEGAAIGSNTRIWHWVHVRSGAQICEDCSLELLGLPLRTRAEVDFGGIGECVRLG